MRSSSTARFRKLRTCPSTEALLLHGRASSTGGRRDTIAAHVSACDFCGAEMQLLSHFTPSANALPFVAHEIPRPLLRLAEDLMNETTLQRARFAESIQEVERLTLTDA
jgi:hypothetical protein